MEFFFRLGQRFRWRRQIKIYLNCSVERNGFSNLMAPLKAVVNFAMRSVIFEEMAFQCVSSFSSCDHHMSLSILRQRATLRTCV